MNGAACEILQWRAINDADLHCRQAAGAGREERPLIDGVELNLLTIDFQYEAGTQRARLVSEVGRQGRVPISSDNPGSLDLLIRRDFRHVDEIPHIHLSAFDADGRVMVDAEVTHWMC